MKHASTAAFLAMILASLPAQADVKPAALFSDHMVLQQAVPIPVWGSADPGEQITVTIAGQSQTATAGPDGKWMVHLAPIATTSGNLPLEMTISGKNTITIKDVLLGEVWIGSGQSNMQFPVWNSPTVGAYNGVINKEQEVAAANYPQLRMFTVKTVLSAKPLDDVTGQWEVCTPDSVKAFSAIGYFFSRDLHQALNVPVGFINDSFGASTAEAWVSRPVMDAAAPLAGLMKAYQTALDAYASRPATAPAVAATTQRARGRNARGPRNPTQDQHNPTVLWNGMLHPIQPYAMRGVVWYQGESVLNGTAGDKLYPTVMDALVTSWRKEWGEGDFPFYVCQLAAQDAASNNPIIRESQAAILSLLNTGMAVTIDIGEKKNVHPKDKQDVGDRLCRIALANVYSRSIECSGPMYQSMAIEGSAIRIKFTHLGGGLVTKNGDLKTFVIAASDGRFVPATAKIDGDTILVSSPDVTSPANVRYAWMNWPEGCNLYNAAGLPAAPFRTDTLADATPPPGK
jgi:sialate O-acetylesterase